MHTRDIAGIVLRVLEVSQFRTWNYQRHRSASKTEQASSHLASYNLLNLLLYNYNPKREREWGRKREGEREKDRDWEQTGL